MKNLKTLKNIVFTASLILVISLPSNAQSFGGATGHNYDTYVINTDRSNHKSEFRMQNRNISFTLSNLSNRMAISHAPNYSGWQNSGTEIFSVNTNGSTTMSNAFVGIIGHGTHWAGFTHKSQIGKDNYSLLASIDGKFTLINKKNTNSGYIGFRVGNRDKMVLSNSGNLGIGTSTPLQKLHVNGNAIISGNTTITGTANFDKMVTIANGINVDGDITSNDTFNVRGTLNFANTDTSQQIGINKGLNLRLTNIPDSHFSIQNAFGADALYVDTDGKIAIGTITNYELTEQLQVAGRIKADGFVADASSFPDYVFTEDYDLMTLEEVKKYTEENYSLPGMPTEKEVINNGLNIKKVITVSVEKIEELYLHTIQQQEEIKNLKQIVAELQKQLKNMQNK